MLYDSFSRLDNRISGVGQTAARIGEHLQVVNPIAFGDSVCSRGIQYGLTSHVKCLWAECSLSEGNGNPSY